MHTIICEGQLTVHGHLVNLRTVVLLNVSQDAYIFTLDKVDSDTLPPITTRTTNPATKEKIRMALQETVIHTHTPP